MKTLYIDCFSGISGDMMVGALIDAGVSFEKIQQELEKLNLAGYQLAVRKVMKEGISSTKFEVLLEKDEHDHHHVNEVHDHSHHHHEHENDGVHHVHNHHHDHHNHHHDHHSHDHDHHGHSHHHRSYADILQLIEESELSSGVKERSKQIFAPIAKSEAKIHNMPIENVHFHEVGAVDSIVDIVATAIALEELEIERVISAHVPLGSGSIRCAHGIYPVPAPATLDMMKNIPIAPTDLTYELTTPTGAAIVVSQADDFGTLPALNMEAIGYGAGTRDIPNRPNVLRIMIGEELKKKQVI
ncbi:LarC family nickel insertion protein [Lederbergia sp. NSJ-179]|uniref:LarC family nickel insertion protein n=1 Tax=Lederbergia sp. NSJ-179 TaxID=2931402 RepID=UPI002454F753|nr:LarC family nickel insertion protein [Lederbergia sp. NSJ-179]